jgi:hypothetical protein
VRKALVFRRTTSLGSSIAGLNLTFVLAYGAALLALWVDVFLSEQWRSIFAS